MSHHFSESFVNHVLCLLRESDDYEVTGHELTVSNVLSMSSRTSTISGNTHAVEKSHDAFTEVLGSGATIYGVNTGFGGSAGTRTREHEQLQIALIQMLNSASYTVNPPQKSPLCQENASLAWDYINDDANAAWMPIKWVRAAMLVRVNTLLRGHSGVTQEAVSSMLLLLNYGITPVIPMLGSISASGDLTPLSYVVSTLLANPTTMVYHHLNSGHVQVIPADEALRIHEISPLVCGPKEALAIVNGTAFSDAVAGLIVHDAFLLASFAQSLTAMAVEAMCGHVESFDPYIAQVKNDEQQAEIARNIRGFLAGSRLAQEITAADIRHTNTIDLLIEGTIADRGQRLAQDRYALRTSAQWLSPPTQDILAAFNTVSKGLNSTTDNPIVDSRDPLSPRIINGGNFQGSATAGAMDKTRSALQLIGKLIFAQSTEVINPMTNNGLPPNLAATDPSMDFCCKGLDINIAAYQTELGWNSNPIGPHVQNAEMLNQSINSLALVSARKTADSVSILRKMMASSLYILCQALDVRVMQEKFFSAAESELNSFLELAMDRYRTLKGQLLLAIKTSWEDSGTYDLLDRVDKAVNATSSVLLSHHSACAHDGPSDYNAFLAIDQCQERIKQLLLKTYSHMRDLHFTTYTSATPTYLSKHTTAMYKFVRQDLRVPMFQGLKDNPTRQNGRNSIGGYVGVIETALKHDEKFMEVLGMAVRDVAGLDVVFPVEQELVKSG